MRLIDADALVEAIKDYPYGFRGMIVCDIAKQPTIDLIEITAAHEQIGYDRGFNDGYASALFDETEDENWYTEC